jgi:hypothetical protein
MKRYITKMSENDIEVMIGEISSSLSSNNKLYENKVLRQLRLFDKCNQSFSNNVLFFEYRGFDWYLAKDLCFFDLHSIRLLDIFMNTVYKDGILFQDFIDYLFVEYYNC